ncbi:MAG: transposase [Oligoflexales bacterium]
MPHHVTHRGTRRQSTFFSDKDYQAYIDTLSQCCRYFGVKIIAYCLMPNHVHLVCEPEREDSLRFAIGTAHETYSKQINYEKGWSGHLWQGRFFSAPMDEEYLAACVRYVEMNPVRAGICESPLSYRWSSAQAHVNGADDKLVKVAPMLDRFPDWEDFLGLEVNANDLDCIRMRSRTGRPIGSDSFLKDLENITGRAFLKQKPGRKL